MIVFFFAEVVEVLLVLVVGAADMIVDIDAMYNSLP
jgi:hypothetical protein